MSFKIAFIGAGSIGFTRKLLGDLLTVPEFDSLEVALCDISEPNLDMIRQLAERDIRANGLERVKLSATTDRREAIAGARYVFCTVRVGGIEAFGTDIDVPLRYGIDQCVGDTLSAGGVMYGQRGIPVILGICRDIREVAESGCRLFNYANPMAMLTWAANDHGGVETIGLCHGVQGGHRQIAEVLGVPQQELDIIAAGINHQTWYVPAPPPRQGHERRPARRLRAPSQVPRDREGAHRHAAPLRLLLHRVQWPPERVRPLVPQAAGRDPRLDQPRHLDQRRDRRLPAGVHREAQLVRGRFSRAGWRSRRCSSPRPSAPPSTAPTSSRDWRRGAPTAATSTSRTTARSPTCRTTPWSRCRATWTATASASRWSATCRWAAPRCATPAFRCSGWRLRRPLPGDDTLLRQAMLLDPLVGAVATPPEVWQLVDDMLLAQRQWLPQYGEAIAAAEERLNSADRLPTREWEGAARLEVRSVEQLRTGDGNGEATMRAEEHAFRLARGGRA